jgi:pentatricopeptide repeat protein
MGGESSGDDVPPGRSLMHAFWGRDEERIHALGEYDADSYPRELAELLHRRQEVAEQVLRIDISDPDARVAAIPTLRDLLRTYPHPLVYETLIHAYVDDGRYDEARGVAFAARERRIECMRSDLPEIRSEVEHLHEWSPDDVEELRRRREAADARAGEGQVRADA